MSFLKKPFKKIKNLGKDTDSDDGIVTKTDHASGTSTPQSVTENGTANGHGTVAPLNGNSVRQSSENVRADKQRRSLDKARVKAENKKRESMARIDDEKFLEEGPPELTQLYRPYSMNQSKRWNHENRVLFKELNFERM
jgi:valyl-tRNA synthetase